MIALIDTIFNPLINWLNQIQAYLQQASLMNNYQIPLANIFAPITSLSPAWAMVVSNTMFMVFIYGVLLVVNNGKEMFTSFVQAIKFW